MARFILLTALTLASAAVHFDTSHAAFEKFMQTHGRNYAGAEKEQRFLYFQENAAQVAAVARATPLAKFKLDGFTDWSPKEIKRQRPSNPMSTVYKNAEVQEQFSDELVHAAYANGPIDWVAKGAVTPAISQGRCGTCAQFSAVGDIEAQWFLAGHPLVALAVQEMIDCSSYTGPYGMDWVAQVHKGIDLATDYPLANHSDPNITGCRSPCDTAAAAKSFATIDGAVCGNGGLHDNETQMMAWLQHGPLSVSVAAGPFNGYHGGIISGQGCNNTQVDHAVLLVGYGVDKGVAYWKVKNSWGPAFGEEGYVRLEHGVKCLGLRGACQAYIGKPPPGN